MRKLLLAGLVLAASAAQAQTIPIITAADMPTVGDSLRLSQAALVLPASAPPLSRNGYNQTWNYAGLVATSQRVARFASVGSATGPLLQFTFNSLLSPDTRATLAAPQNLPAAAGTAGIPIADPLEFYNGSAADFRSVGYGATVNGLAIPVTYATKTQQDVIYRLPLSYSQGNTTSNSLLATPALVASQGYFSQKRQRSNVTDAWGTLTTPFGTFQTVRVVASISDHDSIAIGTAAGQGLTLPLVREYKWLANGIHVPVLTITTALAAGQEIITGVEYRDTFRRFVTLASRDAATDAALSAYPNPSAVGTAVRVAVPVGSGAFTLVGSDLVGRQVFSRSYGGSTSGGLTLDAAAFGSFRGVLLLTVTTAQGTATRRVVRE
ncbi:MAG: T9SS type A sorting domain-containing protein [Hymenobacter sp.]|nr:MAG: T9SS type A sorting domain-containing protein [Hymenobacter sp.]